ncbi:DUF6033 family protein [Halocella sp. SP3-1]|uniref:DUF6033 family protein n=1 Tax=Halocella sp. SP3-1 TaxID=2382161 RepID=UPI000F7659D5|nr:DUF6033 family protein [Halocella sp. SP3-1]AZO95583.1 hypothetical protein D7D81_13845 [Halocella sp. SP3-1]MTI60756.1 hypothetical protein [Bacillota bacterium]
MSIGINTNYSNYYSSSLAGGNKTEEISHNKKKPMSEKEYLKELQGNYPSLKMSIGYMNNKGPSGTGLGNVVIHPDLLKKMADDPEFAAKVENNIKYIPQGEAWLKSMIEASGRKLVASGCFVDENGNVSSWSVSTTTIGNPEEDEEKEKKKKAISERLEEIRQDKSLTVKEKLHKEKMILDELSERAKQLDLSNKEIKLEGALINNFKKIDNEEILTLLSKKSDMLNVNTKKEKQASIIKLDKGVIDKLLKKTEKNSKMSKSTRKVDIYI